MVSYSVCNIIPLLTIYFKQEGQIMAMTASIRLPIKRAYRFSFADIILLLLLLSYIIGFAISVGFIGTDSKGFCDYAKWLFDTTVKTKENVSFINCFLKSIAGFFPYILLIYIFGICSIGCAVIPVIICFRGLCNGMVCSYIYSTYSISGMGLNALVFAPFIVFSAFIILLAGRESVCLSAVFLKNMLPNGYSANMYSSFKTYTLRYLFMIFLTVLASFLDALTAVMFLKYFTI